MSSRDAAPLVPTKALKTGAHVTPHSAPQPPIGADLVLAVGAMRIGEAMARGALEARLAREREGGGDAG